MLNMHELTPPPRVDRAAVCYSGQRAFRRRILTNWRARLWQATQPPKGLQCVGKGVFLARGHAEKHSSWSLVQLMLPLFLFLLPPSRTVQPAAAERDQAEAALDSPSPLPDANGPRSQPLVSASASGEASPVEPDATTDGAANARQQQAPVREAGRAAVVRTVHNALILYTARPLPKLQPKKTRAAPRQLSSRIQERLTSISAHAKSNRTKSAAAGSAAQEIAQARPQRLETGVTLESG